MGSSLDYRALDAALDKAYADCKCNLPKDRCPTVEIVASAISTYLTQTRAQSAPEMVERLTKLADHHATIAEISADRMDKATKPIEKEVSQTTMFFHQEAERDLRQAATALRAEAPEQKDAKPHPKGGEIASKSPDALPGWPETLPCDVVVAPNTVIRKGCKTSTLRLALERRAPISAPQEER